MLTTAMLESTGVISQYKKGTRNTILCYKKTPEGTISIPCRWRTIPIRFNHVQFPDPKLALRADQQKVIDEFETLVKKQVLVAVEKSKQQDPPTSISYNLDPLYPETCICHAIFGHIYTGFGKSITASIYAASKCMPILIICMSDAIRKGWIKTFKDLFGIEPTVASGKNLPHADVCIMTMQTAYSNRYTSADYIHYGTVICDEADTLCTQLCVNQLLELRPKYFIGLTATVKRKDGHSKILNIMWDHPKHWIKRLKEYRDNCSLRIKLIHTGIVIESFNDKNGNLDWTSIAEYLGTLENRNILIRNLCLLHRDKKGLILCKTKSLAKTLYQILISVGEDVSLYFDKNDTYLDARIVISTISKGGRGFDDASIAKLYDGEKFGFIIKTITLGSESAIDQAHGRARGDHTLIYTLVDDNRTMRSHAEKERKLEEKRGAIIEEEYM